MTTWRDYLLNKCYTHTWMIYIPALPRDLDYPEILGLAGRMGSIEVGKDGNIAIFSGDPLDARSWVEVVLIEGKEAYLKTKDRDLEALLGPQERPF